MRFTFRVVFVVLAAAQLVYAFGTHGRVQPPPALTQIQSPSTLQSLQQDGAPTNSYGITSVTLSDNGQAYYVVIQAGNISFRAALDTGSSDLWLVSSNCSTEACSSSPQYPLDYDSPTYIPVNNNGTNFTVSYADGTVASGVVARETIQLSNVTVADQAFGVVTKSNVSMDDEVSGILGLGFSRLSEIYYTVANATPFFSSLSGQGILDYPIFGLYLTRNNTGTLALGAVDSSIVQNVSNIVWNEVVPFSPLGNSSNSSGYLYWAIELSTLSVNNTVYTPIPTYPGPTDGASLALLDVGSSGIYGPYQDVERIYATFPDSRLVDTSGQYVVPCDSSATMSFTFSDNVTFVLQPTDYLIGPTEGDPDLCLSWPVALPPNNDGIDWQLGTPFLRTVYSIFSFGINTKEPPMIGLYPLNNASAPVQSFVEVEAFFSSESATVATTLPNYPISTPSYTTPPYAFNTSFPASVGEIVNSELATSTYSALIGTLVINATALPKVADAVTFIYTAADGVAYTSTSTIAQPSVTLGLPPGWSGASSLHLSRLSIIMPLLWTLLAVLSGVGMIVI